MGSAILSAVALACYIASAACYGAVLFLEAPAAPVPNGPMMRTPRLAQFGRPLLFLGILVQFFAIGMNCLATHRTPFASEFGTLSAAAWAIAIAYAVSDFRIKLPALGALSLLVACLMLFWGMVHVGGPVAESPVLSMRIVSLHVIATIASLGLFALGGGCAALYLLQNRMLKQHNGKGMFRRLPALATLDSVAYHAVAYALPLLTLGLSLGILYIYRGGSTPTAWWADPKTIVSFMAWLLYILYLTARLAAGWRGVRLQYILLIGLLIALALYAIPSTLHHFA